MSSVTKEQVIDLVKEIFVFKGRGATLKQTIIEEIITLANQGTPESFAKLQRLRALIESVFSSRDLGRRRDLDYLKSGETIYVRDMKDGDYLCYVQKGDRPVKDIVFLTCLKHFP